MLKLRDLSVAKNYRDSIKKWGEPDIIRKRVIIAPPMTDAPARNVNLLPVETNNRETGKQSSYAEDVERLFKLIKLDEENDKASKIAQGVFETDYKEYKEWIEKQKKLRADLQDLGLSTEWLLKKTDRSALEERVLKRMQPTKERIESDGKKEKEIQPHFIPTPPPLSKAQMRLLPLLQQPIPVALSIIAEYCHKNKLRLLDLYTQIDKDKDWLISRAEFYKIIKDNKIPLTDAQLEVMIIGLDADNNDQLDYRELAQGVEAYKIDDRWQKIRELMSIVEGRKEVGVDDITRRHKSASTGRHSSRRGRRPSTKASVRFKNEESDESGSEWSDSSLDFLELPKVDTAIKTDATALKAREKRLKKHKERKEKQRKQKQKQPTPTGYLPSTMEGLTGKIKNRYAERIVKDVHQSLDMMHTEGIPVKGDAVKRVLLFPFDKPVEDCRTSLRQPGTDLVRESTFDKSKHRSRHSGLKNEPSSQYAKEAKGERSCHGRRGRHHTRRHSRQGNAFWTDNDSPSLSIEDLGKRTPSDSIFRVVRTPSYL